MARTRFDNPDHTRILASPSWSWCEGLIKAFEQAWQSGQSPAISTFLRGEGATRKALLIELIHVDLEFRLKGGEAWPVERYWLDFPELLDDQGVQRGLIAAEYGLRRRQGILVQEQEYHLRFPQFREELHHLLAEISSPGTRPTLPGGPLAAVEQGRPVIPGYEVIEEIGRGGMGLVYRAHDPQLGRPVALKVLPEEYARDPERLERFLREARTASALNHPHICTVHALGETQGWPFIVMELIEGQTLRELLERGPGWEECARLIAQAARALDAAHRAGVVHRDIKPENVMVRPDGYVKVLDFGLARRLPRLGASEPGRDTDPGALLGTVAYMSPEQAHGAPVDSASDIFSLGIVLYQLTTGQHPFEDATNLATLSAIAHKEPVPARRLNPALPLALEGLIGAMLHKDARLRPAATEIEGALTELLASSTPGPRERPPSQAIIQREPEMAALRAALDQANAGAGALVCVAGEPGIGKTTLVEDFLHGLGKPGYLVARGHCSERRADTEAYLPVIDALEDLLRDSGEAVGRLMRLLAPTWYAQLGLTAPGPTEEPRASSQQAMLRELRNLLQETSRLGTLVLFLDDVHWADVPTVDLLAHLGRQVRSLRMLLIVTCRPTELLLGPHPFHGVCQELRARGLCRDLAVGFLARDDVDRYLQLAFPGHGFSAAFADLIYARTEGSPLFMVDLLRYLRERGVIAPKDGCWALAKEVPDLRQELPGSVRGMIQRKLERLGEEDRRLLGAAAVQGQEFDSAALAGALRLDPAEVEERLQGLDRIHNLVRLLREYEFPDGAPTLRYGFVHILYQQALYLDLPPARRAAISVALARTLESHYQENAEAAAELAFLYEVGRDLPQAARQFWRAAQNAARVFAHKEAIVLARRGLRLLDKLPPTTERDHLERTLQTMLGLQLQVTRGFADPEARDAYTRAHDLCRQTLEAGPRFPVLWGLWLHSKVRSELDRAQEMARDLLTLARGQNDPGLALQAHQALGITALCRGSPATALHHVEQASALYDPARHRTHAFLFGQDPGVICKAFGAVALWIMGYPDQAAQQSEAAIQMSQGLSPSSQNVALHFAAMVHQLRRDQRRTRDYATASCFLAAEHGLSFWLAGGTILEGWADFLEGNSQAGLERLQNGLHDWLATDSVTYHTYHLGLLAEAQARLGQFDAARRAFEEALALVSQTGEGLYEPELYRLRGELLLAGPHGEEPERMKQAMEDFRQALVLSWQQQARSFELRAAMSLARLYRKQGIPAKGKQQLTTALEWFSEGFQTPDLREARELLKGL